MRNCAFGICSALIFFSALATNVPAESGELAIEANDASVITGDNDFHQRGYYTFREDLRLCPSPLCGGIFVKAVNRKRTRCANGTLQEECYVALIRNPEGIDLSRAALLRGRIKAKSFPGFGNLGVFKLIQAFRSATDSPGQGIFVGLENNGIVCITSPCFSYDEFVLNRRKMRTISGIDLEGVGASPEDLEQAITTLADGETLIASGVNMQVVEANGVGITFVANQIYFPILPVFSDGLPPD
ncbi:MAG: DUF6748 domain-containing protein [Gammaproteobacteria bacterium]